MLKLYYKIQDRIKLVDERTQAVLTKRSIEPYSSSLLNLNIIALALMLFVYETLSLIVKYFIILTYDPGESFNTFFKQRELTSCPFSYHYFKQVRAKVRMFSLSGATAMVIVGVVASLVTNFLFGGKNPTQAATFGWTQGSWVTASTTAKASHSTNQAGWNYFYSKDAGVSTSSGIVSLSGANATWLQTNDTDFSLGTKYGVVVTGTGGGSSLKLMKPFGASCSANSDCNDGAGYTGWCNAGVCTNPWFSGPCGFVAFAYEFTNQWKISDTACDRPQCGIDGAQDDFATSSNLVDFTLYPARQACKNIGGRLPNPTEGACLYTNRVSYNGLSNAFWTSNEKTLTGAYFLYSTGGGGTSNKTSPMSAKCIK